MDTAGGIKKIRADRLKRGDTFVFEGEEHLVKKILYVMRVEVEDGVIVLAPREKIEIKSG